MRVGMILLDNTFPNDVRVRRETRSLTRAGFDVSVLAIAGEGQGLEDIVEGVRVRRARPSSMMRKAYTPVHRLSGFSFHPFWRHHARKFVSDEGIDVVHVHDLPYALVGADAASSRRIPWVVDLHENYPAFVTEMRLSWRQGLFFTPERLTRAEKRVVTEADRVVTESPDATRHYAESYGANPGKFIDACNYVDLDLFLNIAIDSNIVERYSSDFTITYVGGIGQHKGMDEVVEAVKIVSEHIDDCRLVVVGGGGYAETLAARVREVGLSDRVEMVGQVPYERVPSYIAASKLCISPVRALSEDAHTSTYHKVFEYMALGKPVVVSDTRVMARIIKDAGCGLLFEPGNSRDLAAKILELTDERLRIEMGERAMRAVKEKYNWASQGEKLVRLYTEIEEHAGRA